MKKVKAEVKPLEMALFWEGGGSNQSSRVKVDPLKKG